MTEKSMKDFEYVCREYLMGLSLDQLRAYGRFVGVRKPTTKKKLEIVNEAIGIFVGKIRPVPVSKRGAPVKNGFVDPNVIEKVDNLRAIYLSGSEGMTKDAADTMDFSARLQSLKEKGEIEYRLESSGIMMTEADGTRKIFKGQLETLNNVPMLLALNCKDTDEKLIISVELIRAYGLEQGDVITCYAEKRHNVLVATSVLTINELVVNTFARQKFETAEVCYPKEKIDFFDNTERRSIAMKYLQWLVPFGKGQRGCVVSSPKAGKSALLLEAAKALSNRNRKVKVFVLLVDQSPENVAQFRQYVDKDCLLCSTYEDEPDRQVFIADFILKRAKRYAECGNDVVLLVDSLNALAHAYNETDESAGGKVLISGLESKTLQYVKRYFGAARCFEKGGSLSILAAVAKETGNPADDLIQAELSTIATLEINLSDELAKKRIYPAIDFMNTQGKNNGTLLSVEEDVLDLYIRNEYLPKYGIEKLHSLLYTANTFEELSSMLKKD